jgi:uncharacterized protein (DUF362 family)
MRDRTPEGTRGGWTRREFLSSAIGGVVASSGISFLSGCTRQNRSAEAFIAKLANYESDIASVVLAGLKELGVQEGEIRDKRILLKPNLVEPHRGAGHINTHPMVIRGAAEAFLRAGASRVLVAEGPGHSRDSLLVLEESGLGEVLREDRIPFVDLNYDAGYTVKNEGRRTRLPTLTLPVTLRDTDWVVSVAKLKTHHWAGVTLSMKNLFGVMPGVIYGWPKNVFHFEGIERSILDINETVKPDFAIVDGVVGMEGDGPIMGPPKRAGVLVMGRNLPATDATCARIMGIDPHKVSYLAAASGRLGPIRESYILQRGEAIASVRTDFSLVEKIDAHKGLRLSLGSI